jgi:N-formylglutamate deformylase
MSGFTVSRGAGTPPVVLASPHSGAHLPDEFVRAARVPVRELRRADDAHVADLLAGAVALGVPLVAATHGRAWLDLNRSPSDIDPAMVRGLPPDAWSPSVKVRQGLGVVPRALTPGRDIHTRPMPWSEVKARLDEVHAPYHATIAELLGAARSANGVAVLLDCHSMPAPPGAAPPEVVLGDRHGTSAAAWLTESAERWLTAHGWRVAVNDPYAGGWTSERHGQPAAGRHALQVEVRRDLYMDPETAAVHGGFARVAGMFAGLTAHLLARLAPVAQAAE